MGGTVRERAFAMADIAGSSRLWNRYPERMSAALARHDAIATASVEGAGGEIVKRTGDGFLATFVDVAQARDALTAYQHALADEAGSDTVVIRSRACVHWGAAEERDGDWYGPSVNHLARLTDLVAPTHVVMSDAAVARLGATTQLDHLGAFSVRDFPEPISLFAVHLADSVGPALTVAAGQGLPRYKASFVGRDRDLEAVRALVEAHRLVTIAGFGGMGKTRLAVEVARQWVEGNEAYAHFVDLTSADDPLFAVADAVGVPEGRITPETAALDAIVKQLRGSRALIVVDNCEHMIDAAANVCDALASASADVRVLATSREALEVEGEAIYPLGALELGAAIELLRQRGAAAGAQPIGDALAARLCERVECMPLGIELVVGRLRHVDAAELALALDTGLDELRARRRGQRDRHATMRALIEWSYELLSPSEQTLLLRLSQFAAPWRREAVASLAPELGPDVLDGLIAKSLVTPAVGGHFRVLEPIRQYCAELLAGDERRAQSARDALIEWARACIPAPPDDRDPVWDPQAARALSEQLPNVRAALDAAARNGRGDDEAAVMIGLWSLINDGRQRGWFGPQLEDTLTRTTDPKRRRLIIRLALMDTVEHHVDTTREARLVALLREMDPDDSGAEYTGLNEAVRRVVTDRVLSSDPTATRERLQAQVERARREGNRLDEGVTVLYLAFSYLLEGEYAACVAAAEDAGEVVRRINFGTVAALADATAAMALQAQGEFETALSIASTAVVLAENARWETSVRAVHALALARVGHTSAARNAVDEVIDLALEHAVPFMLFDGCIARAAVETAAGDRGIAVEAMELAGVGRTPVTIAMLFAAADELELDLSLDRFVEALDADAVDRRAERAAAYLRSVRPARVP